jgi:methionyl-tRNA formyltransferase
MRVAWVSFDVIGRDCLEAAVVCGAEVAAVVTLPGPVDPGRSGQCSFDEVAARLGARLVETRDVNAPDTLAALRDAAPDLIFVVGWSQLVGDDFIALAPGGVFGMHPTLLPRHRGRAPIPWTILSGLATTGVTLFEIADATADSGSIVGQVEVPVAPDETATTLFDRLSAAHVDLVREHLPGLLAGTAPRLPQDPRRASAWPKRTPADGIIDWDTRAPYLYDWVRAQTRPYPGAFTFLGDTRIVVWRAAPTALAEAAPAGTVVEGRESGVVVACGDGGLVLEEVEPEGGGVVAGALVGDAIPVGARLG